MRRQIQVHALAADINNLVVDLCECEIEIALRSGTTATPERLGFISDSLSGRIFVLWSKRLAPDLQRDYVVNAEPPYYVVRESAKSVLELKLSGFTAWEGRPALTQGRIYGVFQGEQIEFGKWYERIVRYIRRRWGRNPLPWMGGYIGPAASEWFEKGGLLLPSYVPPVRSDWIARLGEQHGR
jgi:hypothetical protein